MSAHSVLGSIWMFYKYFITKDLSLLLADNKGHTLLIESERTDQSQKSISEPVF